MTAPLIGYTDRFSARPGETFAVKAASIAPADCTATLVRIRCADANPEGSGMRITDVAKIAAFRAGPQPIQMGSCGIVTWDAPVALPDPCTVVIRVQPRLFGGAAQTVLDFGAWRLVAAKGGAALVAGENTLASVAAPMLENRWYELRCLVANGTVTLRQTLLTVPWAGASWSVVPAAEAVATVAAPVLSRLIFAARDTEAGWTDALDGRLEDPAILPGLHSGAAPIDAPAADVSAFWDFSAGQDGVAFPDRGPHGWHGVFHNLPTRGMRGSRWGAAEMCWRHAPRDYAAVHFHADDLYDCAWPTSFTFTVPADLRSGVYGIRIEGGGHVDTIPIWILPPKGTVTAKLAFLASTFTYQAYANHVRFNVDEGYRARRAAWGAYPYNPEEHPEYGMSTYNRHPDNTGISLSTMRRPILTMRPGYLTFNDAKGSGLRHFPADSHLTDFLEGSGFDFDVITDHDLDAEGVDLLRDYQVVITGSHPEYHTPATMDALQAYIGGGGRLMYMGGNGFYWRIANSTAIPDVIEIRRAESGIRAWAAEAAESYHQLDGGYGGLWRRNGRPPQTLAGVGFSAQGLFEGSHYRRRAIPAEYEWVFAGVTGETFGGEGLSGGGAAGFELDRADPWQGTAPNTVILASSEDHQSHFVAVPEELLNHVRTVSGEPVAELIRADMVIFDTANGGAVFSTGSITWCGTLPVRGYDNDVARITANVLRRFLD